jgi:hypothetical protein
MSWSEEERMWYVERLQAEKEKESKEANAGNPRR